MGTNEQSHKCPGPPAWSRRSFFKAGALGFGGMNLLNLMRSTVLAEPKDSATCDAVVFVCLTGGMSHIDTFDPKPGQPSNGAFKAISTSVDGIQVCEHMPHIAAAMKRATLVRSTTSHLGDHGLGQMALHTSHPPGPIVCPSLGSLVAKERGNKQEGIPAYVTICSNNGGTVDSVLGAGFLDGEFEPFAIADVMKGAGTLRPATGISETEFTQRNAMREGLDRIMRQKNPSDAFNVDSKLYADGIRMMQSKVKAAMDLSNPETQAQEAKYIKDYGENTVGRSFLTARRLLEAGVRFIEIGNGGWDTHGNGYKTIKENLDMLDPALGTLIEDLKARGMLERTMIVCTGEFGRSPQFQGAAAGGGRGHWNSVWSTLLAGGGLKAGYLHGSSDAQGGEVKDKPMTIPDLHATIHHALGVDYTVDNITPAGRPIRIVEKGGEAVQEMFQ